VIVSEKRLGLFGGTFDPPHLGHVAALHAAWASERFDQILVTVASEPYRKTSQREVSPSALRLEMAHTAFDALDGVTVSDMELRRHGATFTIDTVRELLTDGWQVELLIGADSATTLPSWRDAQELARLVSVGIIPRLGSKPDLPAPWRWQIVAMDPVDLSSTHLRELDQAGGDISSQLPPGVMALFRREPTVG
jgi:nicotinate-nucleotide adenylyltransferase